MNIGEWLGNYEIGMDIWNKKYRYHDELKTESFDEWLDRVSAGDEEVKQLIKDKKFLFGGRILANRGLHKEGRKVTYSNCYVLDPPEDNLESIFHTASELARTFSYGGGVGIDISKLAPRGAKINNAAKETSGAVSFMSLYNMTTDLIGQNGRRGALMLSISSEHPDLEEFIDIKSDLNNITKANTSIRVSDAFMNAVKFKQDYNLSFARKETGEVTYKRVKANDIFKKICENNWRQGEPGMLFWDNIKSNNLLSNNDKFEFAGVNPCAEEPLPANGSCLLGALNLAEFVDEFLLIFKESEFRDAVRIAVKALNDVLDEGLPLHPLEKQRETVKDWRQIGLGIMGLADCLIKMGLEYGSNESLEMIEFIFSTLADEALHASALLAKEYKPYPMYNELVIKTEFFKNNADSKTIKDVKKYGLRNSQLLTIAPTGSISTMLGVSGGVEPIFDTHYTRKTESLHGEDKEYIVYTPIVEKFMKDRNLEDLKDLPEYFVTAKTIDPKDRIEVQATCQRHIDASISSTINLPEGATVEDIMDIYIQAWIKDLKGITIFRENCERAGILNSCHEKPEINNHEFDKLVPITRNELGKRLSGSTYIKHVACGKLYITINRDSEGNLVEVFIDNGKSGGCSANAESLGRFASACMRCGMSVESIVDITKGVRCAACSQVKGGKSKHIDGISCGDVLAKTIQEEYENCKRFKQVKHILDGTFEIKKEEINVVKFINEQLIPKVRETKINEPLIDISNQPDVTQHTSIYPDGHIVSKEYLNALTIDDIRKCPDCGEQLSFEGGCAICKNCGYSRCD